MWITMIIINGARPRVGIEEGLIKQDLKNRSRRRRRPGIKGAIILNHIVTGATPEP